MSSSVKDRVLAEYTSMLDSFTNLIKAAKVAEDHADGATTKVPGELMEVFVEKLLASAGALLGIVAELKRNALLNDFAGRNAEVAEAKALAGETLADLQARLAAVEAAIQEAQKQGHEGHQYQRQQQQAQQLDRRQAVSAGLQHILQPSDGVVT
ncbi:hypothetical protein N2152v2_000474 [Parachlorella kessleri]